MKKTNDNIAVLVICIVFVVYFTTLGWIAYRVWEEVVKKKEVSGVIIRVPETKTVSTIEDDLARYKRLYGKEPPEYYVDTLISNEDSLVYYLDGVRGVTYPAFFIINNGKDTIRAKAYQKVNN